MGTTPGRQSDFFWTATCWFWFKVEPNLLVHMFSIFQHVTTLHKFQQRNSVLHCFNLVYRVWESSKRGKGWNKPLDPLAIWHTDGLTRYLEHQQQWKWTAMPCAPRVSWPNSISSCCECTKSDNGWVTCYEFNDCSHLLVLESEREYQLSGW